MTDLSARETNRCLLCKNPLCKTGCPLGNAVPSVMESVREGRLDKAVEQIGHPFGEICGYVCPSKIQCVGACVLNRRNSPVLINEVEKALFAANPYKLQRRGSALSGKSYAVVGGGVSGLTFAAKVYEQGADVTVFERDELLSTVKLIPRLRLPKEAVLRVEQALYGKFKIVNEFVDAAMLKTLQERFDGVYLATGLTLDYELGVEGQALATNYRECLKGNFARGTVVIVGGGNSAMDCARYAKSLGCNATVAYRRTREDMPAFQEEIDSAIAEGVEFIFNCAPSKLRRKNGKLELTLAKTKSEGRGSLIVTDETFKAECDGVIAAIGSGFDGSLLSAPINRDGYLQYDNVYLGGDAKRGKLVVHAVADGIAAANQVIQNARDKCL